MGARRTGPNLATYLIVVIGSLIMGFASGGMYIDKHGGHQMTLPIMVGMVAAGLGIGSSMLVHSAKVRLAFLGVGMLGLGMLIAGFTLPG